MSKLYTAKELEKMIEQGRSPASIPSDAKLTPMARDLLRRHEKEHGGRATRGGSGGGGSDTAPGGRGSVAIQDPVLPDMEYNWTPGGDPKTRRELESFFYFSEIQTLKERICDIGHRVWSKGYVDGNGGNITVRVGDNLVLSTPTLISKGFMTPDSMCLVDLNGNQVAGNRPRTSEVNTHLAIMKEEPRAKACIHAHPVHATAFAVAGVTPPPCVIPEPEVFLGEIGLANYETPGSPENASEVGSLARKHQSILMRNHGVICWGKDLEDAFWKMENTEAFCHTIAIARQIGEPQAYGPDKLKELIQIRQKLGMPDHRLDEMKECELCDAGEFTVRTRPQPPQSCGCGGHGGGGGDGPDADVDEALVQRITDLIMEKVGG